MLLNLRLGDYIFLKTIIDLKLEIDKRLMEFSKKELISTIISGIIGLILIILGGSILEKDIIIGILSRLIGFSFLYFLFYFMQIKENVKKITNIEEWIEAKGEILNTLRDIVILKKVNK